MDVLKTLALVIGIGFFNLYSYSAEASNIVISCAELNESCYKKARDTTSSPSGNGTTPTSSAKNTKENNFRATDEQGRVYVAKPKEGGGYWVTHIDHETLYEK